MPADCAAASPTVELGRFLRTRRARLRPEQVGLFAPGPRRVPGLRREEAAAVAGLSLSYYTRIEQGQVAPPSDSVLAAIGRAFRLGADEVGYLHLLAGDRREPPVAEREGHAARSPAALVAVLATPAIVVDHALDITAWNDPARVELGADRFAAEGDARPNLARMLLADAALRRLFDDPDAIAAWAVGHLRFQLARRPADPKLTSLVRELARDDGFHALWRRHDVHDLGPATVRLLLPGRGVVRMHVDAFRRPRSPDETLLTFVPVADVAERAA